jgi:hypothetical protein
MDANAVAIVLSAGALAVSAIAIWYARHSANAAMRSAAAAERSAAADERLAEIETAAAATEIARGVEEARRVRQRQARQVHVSQPESLGGTSGVLGTYHDVKYGVTVVNSSSESVDELMVNWRLRLVASAERISAGDPAWRVAWEQDKSRGRLLPGAEWHAEFLARLPADQNGALGHDVASDLTFRDAAGVRWTRAADNSLEEGPAT